MIPPAPPAPPAQQVLPAEPPAPDTSMLPIVMSPLAPPATREACRSTVALLARILMPGKLILPPVLLGRPMVYVLAQLLQLPLDRVKLTPAAMMMFLPPDKAEVLMEQVGQLLVMLP